MVDDLLDGPPTSATQALLLAELASQLEPLRRAHGLPAYVLRPGLRLRRLWGRCQHFEDGRPPLLLVRCTADGPRWRRRGAIVATLLHEMAHLRYRGHGQRFWALHRRLLDAAAAIGAYDPALDDPDEGARGDEKLAGSAAHAVAEAARVRRQARSAANRVAARRWSVGKLGRVSLNRGPLAGARVRVLAVARAWLTVEAMDGRRYRLVASVLEPAEAG